MRQKNTASQSKLNIPDIEIINLDEDSQDEENGASSAQGQPSENTAPRHNADFLSRINWHIVFLLAIVICVGLVIFRFSNWGTHVPSFFDPDADFDDSDFIEVLDNMINVAPEYRTDPDGVRTVVVLGNSPFSDNRDADDGVISLVSRMTDATIYNCSVADSHLAASEPMYTADGDPMDAFNLYWLSTLIAMQNTWMCESALDVMGDAAPADARYAYDTLSTLDFQNVDALVIMYDASDYLEERPLYNEESPTDIQTFAGNMDASLGLLRSTFPHIRIIVMSPTYAYYVDENGEYISSDIHKSCGYSLGTYAGNLERITYMHTLSYLDNIYGTVNEDNASEYLEDHLHLNAAGRQRLAERFVYALEYFD
ncbi:MAG: SGNH/GDSL hydrolase family protein [Acetatifactor sp.]|nr:SGNH/GDSL hydrolase family protein [Acetatifactor sp.]